MGDGDEMLDIVNGDQEEEVRPNVDCSDLVVVERLVTPGDDEDDIPERSNVYPLSVSAK